MTVTVAGHWERGWRAPLEEYNDWIHPLREFGLDEFWMSPVSGIGLSRCKERANLDEILAENPTATRVFVDEAATTNLEDFVHPENAIYILGRTGYSPYATHKTDQDLAVKIPTVTNQAGFWGHQAAIIILYDRLKKGEF